MRRPLVIYDFATGPFWISSYMRKFSFLFYQRRLNLVLYASVSGPSSLGKNIEIWRVRKLQIRVRGKVVCALSRSLTRPLHQNPPRPTTEKPQARGLDPIGVWRRGDELGAWRRLKEACHTAWQGLLSSCLLLTPAVGIYYLYSTIQHHSNYSNRARSAL